MSKDTGWIKLHRKIQDNDNYFCEPFCRNMAWVDMLLLANHDENFFRVRGIRITVKRGQIGYTSEKLAERWRWSRGKVLRFLKELQDDKQIVQQKNNITTLISIINYHKYQADGTAEYTANRTTDGTAERQQTVQQTDINKNDNNYNNDNNIRGAGDFASPTDPADIQGFNYLPDGRSFIEPIIMFSKADFNGLPDSTNEDVRRVLKDVKEIELETDRVKSMWESFKGLELTFQKPYRNKEDVYRHFTNWMKRQPFKKPPRKQAPKNKPKEKIFGVEFINDFKQCKMNDGSIRDLTINQQDLAKYNQINPNAILAV